MAGLVRQWTIEQQAASSIFLQYEFCLLFNLFFPLFHSNFPLSLSIDQYIIETIPNLNQQQKDWVGGFGKCQFFRHPILWVGQKKSKNMLMLCRDDPIQKCADLFLIGYYLTELTINKQSRLNLIGYKARKTKFSICC